MRSRVGAVIHLGVVLIFLLGAAFLYVNRQLYGLNDWDFAFFVIAGIGILVLHFAIFSYARTAWTVGAISLVSFALALLCGELFLRERLRPLPQIEAGNEGLLTEIGAMRKQDTALLPMIVPTYFLSEPLVVDGTPTVPLGGIASSRAILCREAWGTISVETDGYGFVNPPEVWEGAEVQIALVGDSFVQGMCLPPERHFAQLVRGKAPLTVNVGAGGNGPLAELGSIREYLKPVAPKTVFWFYYEGNDLTGNLETELASAVLSRYRDTQFSQSLQGRQLAIDAALRNFAQQRWAKAEGGSEKRKENAKPPSSMAVLRSLKRDRLRDWLGPESWATVTLARTRDWIGRVVKWRFLTPGAVLQDSLTADERTRIFGEILDAARREVEGWGGRLVLVYLPSYDSLGLGLENPYRDRVHAIAATLSLPLIDMWQIFAAEMGAKEVFPEPSGHYSPDANALVAREVLKHAGGPT